MSTTRRTKRQLSQKGALLLLILMFAVIALTTFVLVIIFGAPKNGSAKRDMLQGETVEVTYPTLPPTEAPTEPPPLISYPEKAETFRLLAAQLESEHAILLDVDANQILALKGSEDEHIYPASMTKIMTVAIAAEHIENWNDTFTITTEMLEPLWADNASMAGFQPGEAVTMRDLLYGAALPSGADATVGLAMATAGSEEKFVEWMNDKVEELGLKDTHFVNTSGLYDEDHYSSMTDIALILKYALSIDMAREVLSVAEHTTAATDEHPNGIYLTSTMFNKMYGNEVQGITIKGGKTGYTDEAGQCLASYAETDDGHRYIAVTSRGVSKWDPVYDGFKLYGIITGTYPMDEEGESDENGAVAPAA